MATATMDTMLIGAQAEAAAKMAKVTFLASALADAMRDLHGGRWRSHVDHGADTSFVFVRPELDLAVPTPKRGASA